MMRVYNGAAFINAAVAKKTLGFFTNKNVLMASPESNDYRLTEREKEILHLLVEGQPIKTISGNLFISYETVRTHVKHIYKKLHVANRTEVIMKAIQQRLT